MMEAFARNPFSIAVVWAIKRRSRHVLEESVGYENNHVLFVSTVKGGRRITDVVVQRNRTCKRLLARRYHRNVVSLGNAFI